MFGRIVIILAVQCFFASALSAQNRGAVVLQPEGYDQSITLYEKSFALVIGIDDYDHWPVLSKAKEDARAVAAALKLHGFTVTEKYDLTSSELETAIEDFVYDNGRDRAARLFLWFAGHGHTTPDGEGYLVPKDAPSPPGDVSDPQHQQFLRKAVSLRDFSKWMREIASKHVLAVFDSCFAGTVFSTARALPPPAITRATTLPVRQFISSGDADQTVSDDGTFRRLFINSLSGQNGADVNTDGYLTATELGLFLSDKVTNLTSNTQTPRYGKLQAIDLDRGDFVFELNRSRPTDPTARGTVELPADVVDAVVQIYSTDGSPLGSGAIVSYSGLILTAKHVLADPEVAAAGGNSYRVKVKVGLHGQGSNPPMKAELIALHPYLDLAILKLRGGDRLVFPAVPVMTGASDIENAAQTVLAGHRKGAGGKVLDTRTAKIANRDRHGHMLADKKIESSMIGGPAVVGSKVLGVTIASLDNATVVTPVSAALAQFKRFGIAFSEKGLAKQENSISHLESRIKLFESLLNDIQFDVDWSAKIDLRGDAANGISNGRLTIDFGRKYNVHRLLRARVHIVVTPIFGTSEFNALSPEHRKTFSLSAWLVGSSKPAAVFDNIDLDIMGVIDAYARAGLPLSADDLIGLDIKAGIDKTTSAAASGEPAAQVCFDLTWISGLGGAPVNAEIRGSACAGRYTYPDRQASGEQ